MKLKFEPIVMAIVVLFAFLFVLLAIVLVRPAPRFKVVLTHQGCEALARLGQITTALPVGCEVESAVHVGWNWIDVGEIRVANADVIAFRKVKP